MGGSRRRESWVGLFIIYRGANLAGLFLYIGANLAGSEIGSDRHFRDTIIFTKDLYKFRARKLMTTSIMLRCVTSQPTTKGAQPCVCTRHDT